MGKHSLGNSDGDFGIGRCSSSADGVTGSSKVLALRSSGGGIGLILRPGAAAFLPFEVADGGDEVAAADFMERSCGLSCIGS